MARSCPAQTGMVIGGPLNGSIMPGANGGMVIGGPLNGSIYAGHREEDEYPE